MDPTDFIEVVFSVVKGVLEGVEPPSSGPLCIDSLKELGKIEDMLAAARRQLSPSSARPPRLPSWLSLRNVTPADLLDLENLQREEALRLAARRLSNLFSSPSSLSSGHTLPRPTLADWLAGELESVWDECKRLQQRLSRWIPGQADQPHGEGRDNAPQPPEPLGADGACATAGAGAAATPAVVAKLRKKSESQLHTETEIRSIPLELPFELGLADLEVLQSTPGSIVSDLARLRDSFVFGLNEGVCEQLRGWNGRALVGMDVEYDGDRACIVQLATAHCVLIIRLKDCCKESAALDAFAAFMGDENITKAGVGVARDAAAIKLALGKRVEVKGEIDVAISRANGDNRGLGLVDSFNATFDTNVSKIWRGDGGGKWASPSLSRKQLEYAAFDAFMVRPYIEKYIRLRTEDCFYFVDFSNISITYSLPCHEM